ncbi:MAG: hypothetical protein PHY43_01560 [Verrucomicrobiales bacterium]|nr:hypothetical protein [Verrucomicrobiales bacterium]
MQRFLIITTNCVLLVLLLIGLPAATRAQLGGVQLSSASTGQQIMFWGLGIAGAANILVALIFVKAGKHKILCWEWAAIFAALWLAYFGFVRGWFNFEWLKQALQWVQKHF